MAKSEPNDPEDPSGEFPLDPVGYFIHLTVVLDRRRDLRIGEILAPHGLDVATHRVLRVIHKLDACTMGELADYTITDRTTLTRIVDHLVASGHVGRHKPAKDRRKVMLRLTPDGRRVFHKARRDIRDFNVALLDQVTEDDLRRVCRVQKAVIERLIEEDLLRSRLLWEAGSNDVEA